MAQPRLILCVDDETVGLKVRQLLLERAGYKVLTALDGRTGIEIFGREPVDGVVLDYSMPGMTGGEVAAKLRCIKPHIPILMLSAYTSLPPEVNRLIDGAMTKGEGASAFLHRVSALIGSAASQNQ